MNDGVSVQVAAVVIGRNEGANLIRCIDALAGHAAPVIYVDSGSSDGSCDAARERNAEVVNLDMSQPFTAARARNAGLNRLGEEGPDYVQIIDGDCEINANWIDRAAAYLDSEDDVAVVAGRLRERNADATRWNRLADEEWATATGDVDAVGGIALLRRVPVMAAGGFREDLIAGEEPELCLRLRRLGWRIHRLPDEMALHDIAMTRFSQWWQRMRRGGHAYGEAAALYGRDPERFRVSETVRALVWGAMLPLLAFAGALITPWALLLLLAYPLQILRLRARNLTWERAFFLILAKFPEAQGVLGYALGRLRGRRRGLIEYK